MATTEMAGKVQTVLGPVTPAQLGPTMAHEHLLVDLSFIGEEPQEASLKAFYYHPVDITILGQIKYGPFGRNLDNLRLLDVQTTIEEVMLFKQHGGGTVVDATTVGIGRDPIALSRISRATGLNVVMGSSYYVWQAHPADMDRKTEEEITQEIVNDIFVGVGDTGIKAGMVGEVGLSWPMTDNERKALRASGRAQQLTGAPLMIHTGRHETAPLEVVEVLQEVGADLSRTIICHIERTIFQRSTLKKLAQSGCYLEYDLFGLENSYYHPAPWIDLPNDAERLRQVSWLIGEGHGHQVIVSQDICYKTRLVRYGGHGYHYIMNRIVPRMRDRGFSEADIQAILVDNPARIFAFTEPRTRRRGRRG